MVRADLLAAPDSVDRRRIALIPRSILRRFRNSRKAHTNEAMQTTTKTATMGVPLAEMPSMAVPMIPTIAIGRHRSPIIMGPQGLVLVSLRRVAPTRPEDDERRDAMSFLAICCKR